MVEKLKDEDDDEKLVAVEDGNEGEGSVEVIDEEAAKKAAAAAKTKEAKDERLADNEGEEDDSGEDEAQRAARRQERVERKERQRRARERDTREMVFLRNRNEALERRFSGIETDLRANRVMSLDDRIAQTEQQMRVADGVIAEAIKTQNGEETVEAQNIKAQLAGNLTRLKQHREQLAKAPAREERQERQEQQRAAPNPVIKAMADAWVAKNKWYDHSRADEDSAIVGAIDDHLVDEGFDPTEADYWTELDKRVAKTLPHRAAKKPAAATNGDGGDVEQKKPQARGGPQIASGGRERQLRPGEVYVSADRRKALEELGVWDDTVLRKKYLKRYADYDRDITAANR